MNSSSKYCALIVDDQKDSTMVMATMLERRGFKCIHATNPEEAHQMLAEHLPHLLIVDVVLGPDASGIDWLKQVRTGEFHFIPAVMLTGSGDEEVVKHSLELGLYDYVIKPSSPTILEKKIASWLEKLEADNVYSFSLEDSEIQVESTLEMQVSAISETGLCLNSCITNVEPLSFNKIEGTLFAEMDVAVPHKITFMNFEKSPAGAGVFAIRNFCQVSGWTESDFKNIRLFVRRNQLGRLF